MGYTLRYDDNEDYGVGGMGLRLQWFELFGPYLALGPEAALYVHAGSTGHVDSSTHHPTVKYRPLFQLGGVGRLGTTRGRVRPAILMGLGWYKGRFSHLGYSVGAEVDVRLERFTQMA